MNISNILKNKYLFLSFLSGILEFGIILFAIFINLSVLQILLVGVAYQLGIFFVSIYKPSQSIILTYILLAFSLYSLFLFTNNFYILLFSIVLTSLSLQNLRKITKINISTIKKRSYRGLGFLLSFILIFKLSILLIICSLFIVNIFERNKTNITIKNQSKEGKKDLSLIMILHQMHYFSYVYFIPIILYENNSISIYLLGLLITISWLVYMSMEFFLKNNSYLKYAISGHAFLVFLIPLFILFNGNKLIFILIWILTGLGGGTIFALKKILQVDNKYNLELSENIGHLLGVLLSFIIFYIYNSFAVPFIISSISAFAVVILLIIVKLKRSYYGY